MSVFIDRCAYIGSCTLTRITTILICTIILLLLFFEILLTSSVMPFWMSGGLLIGLNSSFSPITITYGSNGLFTYTQSLCNLNLNVSVLWMAVRMPYTTKSDCRALVNFIAAWNTLAKMIPYWWPITIFWCISVILTIFSLLTLFNRTSRVLCVLSTIFQIFLTLTIFVTLILFCISMYTFFFKFLQDPPPSYIFITGTILHIILGCSLFYTPISAIVRNNNYVNLNYNLLN